MALAWAATITATLTKRKITRTGIQGQIYRLSEKSASAVFLLSQNEAGFMNEHLTDKQSQAFQARTLSVTDMVTALLHLENCESCRERSHKSFQQLNDFQPSTIFLTPEYQLRHEHLEEEQLTALADHLLGVEEREILRSHLKGCLRCSEELRGFLAFRQELTAEFNIRYAPISLPKQRRQWTLSWRIFRWKPLYAGLLVTVCLVALTLFLWVKRSKEERAINTPSPVHTTPIPLSDPRSIVPLTPMPTTNTSQQENEVIASLRDQVGIVGVTSAGKIKGVEGVSADLQHFINEAVRTPQIKKPAILNDLKGEAITTRGSTTREVQLRLRTPVGVTVLADRPVLRWQPIADATRYEVVIADARGNEVARSESLSTRTTWQPSKALQRGVVYTWTVNDRSVTTPAPMFPESKFKVLEITKVQELARLKKQVGSHLVLGLFYAREGMLIEAEQELKFLARMNPHSPVARKLLRAMQSWR